MTRRLILILALLATSPVAVLGAGFFFHSSFDAAIFGKYTWRYLLFLCVWWLALTPAVFFFWRFVFRTQRIVLPESGRVIEVRPAVKLVVLLIAGLFSTLTCTTCSSDNRFTPNLIPAAGMVEFRVQPCFFLRAILA